MCGTLEESGVASGSTVELKFRGRGGGPEPPTLTTWQDNDFPDEPPMPHSSRIGLGQLVSSGGTQETDTPASNQAANSLEIEVEPQPARSVSLATRVMRSYDNDGDVIDDLDPPISLVQQEAQPQQEEWPSRLSTPLRDPNQRREMPAANSLQLVVVPREPSQRREHARQQPPPVAVTVDVSSDMSKKATWSKDKRATVMPSRKISFRSFRKAARCPSYMTRRSLTNTLYSPIGAVLLVCVFTFLWCLAEIISPPPFGLNTGWNGGGTGCNGTDSQPLDICICPRETVCVKDVKSLVFLAFARLSAYFDYPLYVLLFASKAHNLRGALYRTHLREFLPLDDLHHLHTFAGAVSFEVIWHSFWHILRWGLAGDRDR